MLRHFLSQNDLTVNEILDLFSAARRIKTNPFSTALERRTLVMFFEKSSTRTRLSFEIGMTQLGGHAVYLDRDTSQLSRGESLGDTAQVVSRYADLMMARVFSHSTLNELARFATIPIINALSDLEHPCQSLADLFTMFEHFGELKGRKLAYVGDGNNNVAHSLILGATQFGMDIVIACPAELQPDPAVIKHGREKSQYSGGSIALTSDPLAAVSGADVVYTDVWVSMGQEADRERRSALLRSYQVNEELISRARPDCIFMHCLPAHIGDEVTRGVAYGPHSVIFDQAENRLHVQKVLMVFLFESSQGGTH